MSIVEPPFKTVKYCDDEGKRGSVIVIFTVCPNMKNMTEPISPPEF